MPWNALAGHDPLDCTSQPVTTDFTANLAEGVSGMRIGVVPAFMEAEGLAPEVRAKVEESVEHLRQMGAEIVEVDLPNAQAAMSAYYVLGPCEASPIWLASIPFATVTVSLASKTWGISMRLPVPAGFGLKPAAMHHAGRYLLSAGVYRKVLLPGSARFAPLLLR